MKARTASVAMLLATALGYHGAEARDIPYDGSFSGSVVATEVDTNGDGIKAALFLVNGKTSLGPTDVQAQIEFAPSGPATCPNGHAGLQLTVIPGAGNGVIRFEKRDGDLLITEISPKTTLCVDPATGLQFLDAEVTFAGGTGRFANATGSIAATATNQVLFQDAAGHFFSAQSGEFTGTIIVP